MLSGSGPVSGSQQNVIQAAQTVPSTRTRAQRLSQIQPATYAAWQSAYAGVIDNPAIGLAAYVVLSGLRSTVLKALQIQGEHVPINGENPISFCNVFLISQTMVGLAHVFADRGQLTRDLARLDRRACWLLAGNIALGSVLAPMNFFLALDQLSVINQTLLFSLTLPVSAAIALLWWKEPLPDRFWWSLPLIIAGLLIGKLLGPMLMGAGPMGNQTRGVLWALVSILATALRHGLGRKLSLYAIGRGLSAGVPNLAGALAFAVIALKQYGPQHFFYLSIWWVLGVIVIYGFTLCLGTELLKQVVQQHFTGIQIGLASTATLVVTILSAAIALGEPIHAATWASMVLILTGVSLRFVWPRPSR